MSGAILAFLIFNFQPARIFMGDTGSLLIGLVNAILVIKFINVAGNPATSFSLNAAPAIGFGILMVPLFDTLRVFAIRMFQRRSPFSPDRNHIHHILLDLGLTHRSIAISLLSLNAGAIAIAFGLNKAGCNWVIGTLSVLFFAIIGALLYLRRQRPRLFVTPASQLGPSDTHSKIVPLTEDAVLQQK
ncbi:MAG: MraY family glycosyltransferase [Flavihumibacter sp.]